MQRQIILLQKNLEISNKKLKNEKDLNDILERKNYDLQLTIESLSSKSKLANGSSHLASRMYSVDASVFKSSSLSSSVDDVSHFSHNQSITSNLVASSQLDEKVERLDETINEKNDIIAKYEKMLFNSDGSEQNGMTKSLIMSYKNEKEKIAKKYEALLIKFKDTSNILAGYEDSENLTNKMKYDLQMKTGDVNKLSNEVKVLKEESSALQSELENYKKNGLAEYEVKLQLLNIHILKSRQGEEAMRIEKNEMMDKYTELLVAAQLKNDELLSQMNQGGADDLSELNDRINTLTKERDRFKQALQIKIEENDEINNEKDTDLAELENRNNVLSAEIDAILSSHKEEINSYRSKILLLNECLEKLQNEKESSLLSSSHDYSDRQNTHANELIALKTENDSYVSKVRDLNSFVSEHQETILHLSNSLRDTKAESEKTIQNLESKINSIDKTEIANYREKIKQLENDLLFAQKCVLGLDDTKNDIIVLSNQIESYKNEIKELKAINSNYEDKINFIEISDDRKSMVQESDYKKVLSELNESNAIVSEYEQKITEGVEYVSYLKNLISEKETLVASSSADMEEMNEKMRQGSEYCSYLKDLLAEKEIHLAESFFQIEQFNEKMQQVSN